jgi:Xaa-Pro aminopeptidase
MRRDEFGRRRRQLMRHMGRDSIAILPAAPVRIRNNDVEYGYRPDSDFYYLTSFPEPEAVAVLIPGRPRGEYVLFVRDRDPAREAWDGARAGPEGAVSEFGADDAFPIGDIDEILPGLLERCSRVFYTMGAYPEFDQRVIGWVTRCTSCACSRPARSWRRCAARRPSPAPRTGGRSGPRRPAAWSTR